MSGPEFIVAIVAIGCIIRLIKKWMDNRCGGAETLSKEQLNELQQTFEKHEMRCRNELKILRPWLLVETRMRIWSRNIGKLKTPSSGSSLHNHLQQKERE